tara:strand:- start:7931 stop:8242 length:312 start_codon:yes stop_codon:yes gene_type:complete
MVLLSLKGGGGGVVVVESDGDCGRRGAFRYSNECGGNGVFKTFPFFFRFFKTLNILFKKYARKLCSRKKEKRLWCVCFPKTLWAVVVTTTKKKKKNKDTECPA